MIIMNNKFFSEKRKRLRYKATKSEVVLWKHLRDCNLDYKFRRQTSIGTYIVDFYCSKKRLAIEIDGGTHRNEEVYKKDIEKTKYLLENGVALLRIKDREVLYNLENVLKNIILKCESL